MFRILKNGLLSLVFTFISIEKCICELVPPPPPYLVVYSPGSLEYSDVLVWQVHDNMTLVCELRGESKPRRYLWSYLSDESQDVHQPLQGSPVGLTTSSTLHKSDLQLSDSGQYICSAPPYSQTKHIVIQTKGPAMCARGAFWCGNHCVLPGYVCDGRTDCERGEDEATELCGTEHVCAGSDKYNCSGGRCVSRRACCTSHEPLCRQPSCCDEHLPRPTTDGFVEVEYPALFEDRHPPDDYGFIQSTIYTVTACALIFMIAVVLLVSAICKMHMKRSALRTLHARRGGPGGGRHIDLDNNELQLQYGVSRYPPCYEASRLLEESLAPPSPPAPCTLQPCTLPEPCTPPCTLPEPCVVGGGLARLGAMFSSRYRQVPTSVEPAPVEMTSVRGSSFSPSSPSSAPHSPSHLPPPQYSRPARPLTLRLSGLRLTLPSFGRGAPPTPPVSRPPPAPSSPPHHRPLPIPLPLPRARPGTPDVPAVDTYTLNGRTIRLLGAEIDAFPPLEGAPYKALGPPPEYLPRETPSSHLEMPPRYEDLPPLSDDNGNTALTGLTLDHGNTGLTLDHDLPPIDADLNANETVNGYALDIDNGNE